MSDLRNALPEFYQKLEKMLNVAPGEVRGDQLLTQLKSWDSLTILEFMMLASSEYNSDMQPEDIAACSTVDDLQRATLDRSLAQPEGS